MDLGMLQGAFADNFCNFQKQQRRNIDRFGYKAKNPSSGVD